MSGLENKKNSSDLSPLDRATLGSWGISIHQGEDGRWYTEDGHEASHYATFMIPCGPSPAYLEGARQEQLTRDHDALMEVMPLLAQRLHEKGINISKLNPELIIDGDADASNDTTAGDMS